MLFPSLREGFPLAALEGMACGLALVATDIPGIAERLTHGDNAILIPARDPEAIFAAVDRLVRDRPLLDRIRRSGHARAQDFSWGRIARDTIALYGDALERKRWKGE